MITKVTRGWDPRGLIAYLLGPGAGDEHTDPTVIAAWNGDPAGLQPPLRDPAEPMVYAPGAIETLATTIARAATDAAVPTTAPPPGAPGHTKHGPIWQCSLSLAPGEPPLTHTQWREIAEDLAAELGVWDRADQAAGCRWWACHHGRSTGRDTYHDIGDGNDHIHLMVVLVDQLTGRRVHPSHDRATARNVARRWEHRLGLAPSNPAYAAAAAPSPTRGEIQKAADRAARGDHGLLRARPGAPARTQLRQVILESAAVTTTPQQFLDRLSDLGIEHSLRREHGAVTGWKVAALGDRNSAGGLLWHSGKSLGRDLSWPHLAARHWTRTPPAPLGPTLAGTAGAGAVFTDAAAAVQAATDRVRSDPAATAKTARDLHDILAAWAAGVDGVDRVGPVTEALWAYQDSLDTTPTPAEDVLGRLRRCACSIAMLGIITDRHAPTAALALAVAELLLEVAAWHQGRGRLAAAAATRTACDTLTAMPARTRSAAAEPGQVHAPATIAEVLSRQTPAHQISEPRSR